jgi:phosphohistidine phosphatase
MKRLTLLRHAKSGEDLDAARDFDRTLNAKGRRAARTIGRHMRDAALRFDAVIASPATRVAQTLEEVAAGYGQDLAPRWEKRAYLASPSDLLDMLQEAPSEVESLLIVGHNPGLEQLVLMLVPEDAEGARDAVMTKYPTAALAEMTLDIGGWDQAGPGRAALVRFVRPRDLDPELGPEYG